MVSGVGSTMKRRSHGNGGMNVWGLIIGGFLGALQHTEEIKRAIAKYNIENLSE